MYDGMSMREIRDLARHFNYRMCAEGPSDHWSWGDLMMLKDVLDSVNNGMYITYMN